MPQLPQEIKSFLNGNHCVPRKRFEQWTNSDDPRVLEAAIDAVSVANERIEPPVDELLFFELIMRAVTVSLTKSRRGGALSPYLLSGDLLSFLQDAKARLREQKYHDILRSLEERLKRLAHDLSPEQNQVLINAFLEHLFESAEVRSFFGSWRTDPSLAELYQQAEEWSAEGPSG